MSEVNPEPVAKLKRLPRKVWVSIIAGLAILIVLPFSLIQLQKQLSSEQQETAEVSDGTVAEKNQAPDTANELPVPAAEGVNVDPEPEPGPSVDSVSLQETAIQQAKLLRVRKQGERITRQWESLSAAQNRLSLSLTALQSDDVGKQIASNSELIDQFVALHKSAGPAADLTTELGEELNILLAPLAEIEATQIQTEFKSALDDLANRVDTQLTVVKRDQRMLDALESVAATRDSSDKNLTSAIADRERELAGSQIAKITSASAQARDVAFERAAKESAEEQRKIAQAERDVERLKEQERLAALAAEKASREAAIAKAQLQREFQQDLPQIRSLLRPLITEGLTQPGKNGFVPSDKKEPVSLAKLRGTGSLGPTAKARAGLYYIVGNIRDRDLGSFPRYTGGAQDVQSKQSTMMRVQELVNKYGELMVEKGMMAE